jgi:trk system potassium uptake protein TrkH
MLVPLALSLVYGDNFWQSFLLPAVGLFLVGAGGIWATGIPDRRMGYASNRDVYLFVKLAWSLAALLGRVPYLIERTFSSLLDSTFEAMSGFTTTGATLLSDKEGETPSILFWRSMTHWLAGIGSVVLLVAVAPLRLEIFKVGAALACGLAPLRAHASAAGR